MRINVILEGTYASEESQTCNCRADKIHKLTQ